MKPCLLKQKPKKTPPPPKKERERERELGLFENNGHGKEELVLQND